MKRFRKIYFGKASDVPNSTLAVLLYSAVLHSKAFRERFKSAGWKGIWTIPTRMRYLALRKVKSRFG